MKNFQFLLLVVILFFFLIPHQVEGLDCTPRPLVPCGPGTTKPHCQLCDFFVLFGNIIDFLLCFIVAPLAVLFIAIGGFCFIFGFAEEKTGLVNKGKDIIKTTLIGLVIIFAAWLVVNLFFQIIGVADWTGLKNWWQIPCD